MMIGARGGAAFSNPDGVFLWRSTESDGGADGLGGWAISVLRSGSIQ